MPTLRSSTTTSGRTSSGARALWRATGLTDSDFGRPIVAIANSFSEFVPGHVHLRHVSPVVAEAVRAAGGVPREFNTIAVDDGIAMGHDGMLYSLPSRDLIADAVEYVVEAHCADALVCISNCDKITPGMLMAALRLNVPTVFMSGGPMEAGRPVAGLTETKVDLISAVVAGGDDTLDDDERARIEEAACPTCGSCSGMFTANSMNCLTEALGLALPGNGTVVATHADRRALFETAGRTVVDLARRYYDGDDDTALPRSIASEAAFDNAVAVDIAMGGSTNTVLHLLAAAHEAGLDYPLDRFDEISRRVPVICKVAPSTDRFHIEDVHRAGGIPRIMGELARAGLVTTSVPTITGCTLADSLADLDVAGPSASPAARALFAAAPGGVRTIEPFSQRRRHDELDLDDEAGCVRSVVHAYSTDGGLAVLRGNLAPDGCVVKSAGVEPHMWTFTGPARVYESQDAVAAAILDGEVRPGDCLIVRYEGPRGGPGMQEMLHPTSFLRSRGLDTSCALVTDGRFSGGSAGLSVGHVSPEAAAGGPIGLVADGDVVTIDIDARSIAVHVDEATLDRRRRDEEARGAAAWTPHSLRQRRVSVALAAYAALTTSASHGAVRRVPAVSAGSVGSQEPEPHASARSLQ